MQNTTEHEPAPVVLLKPYEILPAEPLERFATGPAPQKYFYVFDRELDSPTLGFIRKGYGPGAFDKGTLDRICRLAAWAVIETGLFGVDSLRDYDERRREPGSILVVFTYAPRLCVWNRALWPRMSVGCPVYNANLPAPICDAVETDIAFQECFRLASTTGWQQ
jgi:hypothetical protein